MNKKKVLCLGIILLIIIIGAIWIINKNGKEENVIIDEYTPAPEIGEDELRYTGIDLYFKDIETKELRKESRLVDSKILIDAPYYTIMNFLLEGPNDEELEIAIPEGTKLNKIELKDGILYIDLSEEFNNQDGKELAVNSIIQTLSTLKEINDIKISVNGEELLLPL